MKPLRKRLEEARKNTGLPWEIIEGDYILSWVLAGIGVNEKLRNDLIFKGGTALKKCYFGEYRFSEDLDFTAKESVPRGDKLEKEIQKTCELATNLAQEFSPLELKADRYTEKEPFHRTYPNIPRGVFGVCFLLQRHMTRRPQIILRSAARGIFTGVTSRGTRGRYILHQCTDAGYMLEISSIYLYL